MKHTTEVLNVDAVKMYRHRGEVIVRLITPVRQYDVALLPHHAKVLAKALNETSSTL